MKLFWSTVMYTCKLSFCCILRSPTYWWERELTQPGWLSLFSSKWNLLVVCIMFSLPCAHAQLRRPVPETLTTISPINKVTLLSSRQDHVHRVAILVMSVSWTNYNGTRQWDQHQTESWFATTPIDNPYLPICPLIHLAIHCLINET